MRSRTPKKPRLAPRKKPLQERSRHTVEAIVQATTYILLKHGWEGLNTNRVAERAGVNIASLYQYFPNKQALLAEVMQRHVSETRQAILQVMVARRGRNTLRDNVRALVEASIAAHVVAPKLHAILTAEAARLQLPRFQADADEGIAAERELWTAAAAHQPALSELSMWMAITAAHAIIHTACLERPEDVKRPEFAEELTRLVTQFFARA